jgi:ABC-type Na+ efflux pump permease subunit
MKPLTLILGWLNNSAQPPEAQSPMVAAATTSFVSFLFVSCLNLFFVTDRQFWWEELLVCTTIPILLAFIALYRTAWHHELRRTTRTLLVALTSCAVFGAVAIGTFLATLAATLAYASCLDRFLAFHY